jgi:hypothetical protein
MVRRSENTFSALRRRCKHRVVLNRECGTWLERDSKELDAAVERIADGTDHVVYAGSHADGADNFNKQILAFADPDKAREAARWIEESGIEHRPQLKWGLTPEEQQERYRLAFEWGERTGVMREAVRTYADHRARHAGEASALFWAAMVVREAGDLPFDDWNVIAKWFVLHAQQHHPDWLGRRGR